MGVDGTYGVQGAAQYVYDAFNRRVETVSEGGTALRYGYNLNGQRASTWAANGSLQTANYYADGMAVGYWSATDGGVHYIHQDWAGTVRMRTTQAGGVDGTYFSYAYGDGYAASGNDSDPLHYALLDHDTDSWTEHAGARQYASVSGRWMSPDPYAGSYSVGNPQSMNRYAYAGNNPMSYVDPAGMQYMSGGCDGPSGDPCGGGAVGDGTDEGMGGFCDASGNCMGICDGTGCVGGEEGFGTGGSSWGWGAGDLLSAVYGQASISNNQLWQWVLWANTSLAILETGYGSSTDWGYWQSGDIIFPEAFTTVSPGSTEMWAPSKGPTVPANPCAYRGNALPPSAYAAQGAAAKYNPINFTLDASMGFPRGDFLDAQMGRSGWNVAAYGNYVFGVYMQAAGVPLGVALRGAEAYAATKTYPMGTPMAPGYPGLPSANAANISNGFNAQASGTTCQR